MAHIVHCRVCSKEIDIDVEEKDKVWVMPSRNWYYHKKCWEEWKKSAEQVSSDEDWYLYIFDYLARDLKMDYDYWKCRKQIESYLKKYDYTLKGIFFSLKYFYEVRNGDIEKSNGGVGIIPSIYNEACQYWVAREERQTNILEEIETQLRQRATRKIISVKKKKKKSEKFEMPWEEIEECD